jgi:hypothetical protein
MKQKTDTPVTKKEVTEILQDYPAKTDLKEELKHSEDRSEKKFKKLLQKSIEAFRREMDHKLEIIDERWERRFTTFESRLVTLIDPLLQEIKTRQQEREVVAGQISRVEEDIDNLKKKVTKLEHAS